MRWWVVAIPKQILDQVLVVLENDGAVLKQGRAPPKLCTPDDLSLTHQDFASRGLGKAWSTVESRSPAARCQGGRDAEGAECAGQQSVNRLVRLPQGSEPLVRCGDSIGQFVSVPHRATTGWPAHGV